jgi:phosphoglycolate phosphatase-like HAD superfamily hydrolase
MNLFFDLDGTLIDIKKRHIAIYHAVARRMNLPLIPDEEYWQRKRNKQFPWDDVSENTLKIFRRNFKEESELPSYLSLDTLLPHIKDLLHAAKQQYTLLLLTKRNNREHLINQLDALQISSLFDDILTPGQETKQAAVLRHGFGKQDSIVGDTEEDIITAKALNLSSIAVTWGLRTKAFLKTYAPTHIVSTISELHTLLLRN